MAAISIRRSWSLICVACCLVLPELGAQGSSAPRIAIVGAGVGGSSAAWFLRDLLGKWAQIDMFEDGEIGGRTQTFEQNGSVYEMGASIIHQQNFYFRHLVDAMGLERQRVGSDGGQAAIFDGKSFVFRESPWTLVTLWRMLWRYGLSYQYMRPGPSAMLERYKGLYKLQGEGRAFRTPEELLSAVDLYSLTQRSFRDELEARIGSSPGARRFASEFVAAINRIQYNQGNDINGLAGMVSLLPSIDGRLFRVKGGNKLLPQRLITAANGTLAGGSRVSHVTKDSSGTFSLTVQRGAEREVLAGYDAVLVAVPLELANITFGGFQLPKLPMRTYQTTVTTLVQGRFRPEYFGVQALPRGTNIMVTEDAQMPFSVIGPQKKLPDGLTVYKLFSRAVPAEQQLLGIFQNLTVLAQQEWLAYPRFQPPEQFQPFELTAGLYLNNAWENAASAMEMSIVAAKNCALLTAQHLAGHALTDGSEAKADVTPGAMRSELR